MILYIQQPSKKSWQKLYLLRVIAGIATQLVRAGIRLQLF